MSMSFDSHMASEVSRGGRAPPTDANLNNLSQEYLYEDLVAATGGFSSSSRLGMGTYGSVYQGTLRDGTEVAVKALGRPNESGFREEVEVLSRFRHPNLVILMGFARHAEERYLVYELLPGGDVCARLQKDPSFNWRSRLSVILDAALGLSHLHGSRPQVFHRDIKTQNILMDRNGTGKMADFGLALLAKPDCRSLTVENTSGTIGYADPAYIRTGRVTEASEVYSFGTVLLEILTGQPPALQYPDGHIEYQFSHIKGELSRVRDMLDPRGHWPPGIASLVGSLALRCIHEQQGVRPSFTEIVSRLRRWLKEHGEQQAASSQAAAKRVPEAKPAPVQQPLALGASSSSSSKAGAAGEAGQASFASGKARAVVDAGAPAEAAAKPPAGSSESGSHHADAHSTTGSVPPKPKLQPPSDRASPLLKHREVGASPLKLREQSGGVTSSPMPGSREVAAGVSTAASSSSPSNPKGAFAGSVKLDLSLQRSGVSPAPATSRAGPDARGTTPSALLETLGPAGSWLPGLGSDVDPFIGNAGPGAASPVGRCRSQDKREKDGTPRRPPISPTSDVLATNGSPRPALGREMEPFGVRQVPLQLAGWGSSPSRKQGFSGDGDDMSKTWHGSPRHVAAAAIAAATAFPRPEADAPVAEQPQAEWPLAAKQPATASKPRQANLLVADRPARGPPPTESVMDCDQIRDPVREHDPIREALRDPFLPDPFLDVLPGFYLDDSPRACVDCGPPKQRRTSTQTERLRAGEANKASSGASAGSGSGTSVSTRASTNTGSSVSIASMALKTGSSTASPMRGRGTRNFLLGSRNVAAAPEVAGSEWNRDSAAQSCMVGATSSGGGIGGGPIALKRDNSAKAIVQMVEETQQRLQALGFSDVQSAEACKRCSTVEGAIDWILSPERPWNRHH